MNISIVVVCPLRSASNRAERHLVRRVGIASTLVHSNGEFHSLLSERVHLRWPYFFLSAERKTRPRRPAGPGRAERHATYILHLTAINFIGSQPNNHHTNLIPDGHKALRQCGPPFLFLPGIIVVPLVSWGGPCSNSRVIVKRARILLRSAINFKWVWMDGVGSRSRQCECKD